MQESNLNDCSKEQLLEIIKGMAEMVAKPTPKMVRNMMGETLPKQAPNFNRNHPYYKEQFALGIRPHLDTILKESCPIVFSYADFPNYHADSLWARIHWGWKYLADFMDVDGKYRELRKTCQICKRRGGVFIVPDEAVKASPLISRRVDEGELTKSWRQRLDEFIESGEVNSKLTLDQLVLSEDDQTEVKMLLYNVTGILASVTSSKIVVIKYDPENPPEIIRKIVNETDNKDVRVSGG